MEESSVHAPIVNDYTPIALPPRKRFEQYSVKYLIPKPETQRRREPTKIVPRKLKLSQPVECVTFATLNDYLAAIL